MSDLSKLNDKQSLLLTQLSYYSDKAKSLKFYCDKRAENSAECCAEYPIHMI